MKLSEFFDGLGLKRIENFLTSTLQFNPPKKLIQTNLFLIKILKLAKQFFHIEHVSCVFVCKAWNPQGKKNRGRFI